LLGITSAAEGDKKTDTKKGNEPPPKVFVGHFDKVTLHDGYANNPLRPPEKNYDYKILRSKPFPLFPLADPKICNFWLNEKPVLTVAPWPKNCLIYQYKDKCAKYEISHDGKTVESCEQKEDCKSQPVEPACLQEFPPRNLTLPLFPYGGKQCDFKEALYPIKPWPRGCKVYQADRICYSYELADNGSYIKSCDVPMWWDQCLNPVKDKFKCIEWCPLFNCIKDDDDDKAMNLTFKLTTALIVLFMSAV
jgi:hypothetical protein